MKIPLRFRIAAAWLNERRHGRFSFVPASEMLAFLASDSWRRRGLKYVERIEPEGDLLAIFLRGQSGPLYWPVAIPLADLSQILDEQLAPRHWHRYLTPETFLGPDDVVADCGASEGLFSFLNRDACRHLHAFEPGAGFVQAMERTFAGDGRVTIHPCALGRKRGTARFSTPGIGSAASPEGDFEVPVVTLDEIADGKPITFIKADLEGAELDMLEGARETISAHRPKIAIATYHNRFHARDIEAFLRRIHPGYRIRLNGFHVPSSPIMLHAWI